MSASEEYERIIFSMNILLS